MIESLVCLALTIYFESRGEAEEAMKAVGHVVLNRVESDMFPNTVCDVVYQGGESKYSCQFTWYCDGFSDRPKNFAAWQKSLTIATEIYGHADNTNGSLWYHADYVQPEWAGPVYYQIGTHKFYSEIEK